MNCCFIASVENLTAEEHLGRLKTQLEQVSLQMQNQAYREIKEIKNDVDQCVKMCDIVRTKLADEMELLSGQIRQLKDQSHHGITNCTCYVTFSSESPILY